MSAPNWSNVTVQLSALVPWEHNPRTMTKRQAQRLLKSWRELGQFQTIAIGPDGQVYDGHQRLSALLTAYGAAYSVEARQSDRVLTEDERRYLITQANLPVGAWNFETIAGWPEAQEWGFDDETMKAWREGADNIDQMLASAADEQLTERDERLEARQYLRVLISVPLDNAIDAREIIEQITDIEGAQIDYGAN